MRDYEGEQPAHDTQVYTRETREYMHARLAKHKSRELHIRRVTHTQKTHFKVFLGIFRLWCLLESFS